MISAKEAFVKTTEGIKKNQERFSQITEQALKSVETQIILACEEGRLTAKKNLTLLKKDSEHVIAKLEETLIKNGFAVSYLNVDTTRTPLNHHAFEFTIEWKHVYDTQSQETKADSAEFVESEEAKDDK